MEQSQVTDDPQHGRREPGDRSNPPVGPKKKVFAYRLIAKNTVEERVAELQAEKRDLVNAVLAGSSAGLRGLSVQDIDRLLQ